MQKIRIACFLWLTAQLFPTTAYCGRQYRSSPFTWHHGLNTDGPWAAGLAGYWGKYFKVVISNSSSLTQNVRVTCRYTNGRYTENGATNLNNQIHFEASGPNYTLASMGPSATSGTLVIPSATTFVALAPFGQANDNLEFIFKISYAGPANGYLWLDGTAVISVDVQDDRGAIAGGYSFVGGCAGNCPVKADVNSISTASPAWVQFNSGRPF